MMYVLKTFIFGLFFFNSNVNLGDNSVGNVNSHSHALALFSKTSQLGQNVRDDIKSSEITLRFTPTDDAYLQQDFGKNTKILKVGNGLGIAFLKFNVENVDGVISHIKLRMHVSKNTGKGHVKAYRGVGNNWDEDELTISSAPIKGGLVGSRNGVWRKDKNYTLDVSSLLSGNGEISLLLEMDDTGDGTQFTSVEGSPPPELIVTFKR